MIENVPDGWMKTTIEDAISVIADGGTPSTNNPEYFNGDIPWVVIDDIQPRITRTKTSISDLGLRNSSAKLWDKGTIILSTGATIGKVGIALKAMATKQGICGIVTKENVSTEYFYYLLISKKRQLNILSQGSTIKETRPPTIKKIQIILPPLSLQKKIASILTSVDEVIENTQKQIEKLYNLKKATMNELLTKGINHKEFKDSKLGRIPKSWNVKKLIEVGKCVRGLTFTPENVVNNGLLVLRSSNIQDGSLSFKDNVFVNIKVDDYFLSKDGDILICVRNGSRHLLGKSALITGDRPISTHGAFMTIFRTDNYKFVRFLIQSDWFFTQVSRDIGATINSINNNNLLDYRFAFPPLNEQIEISKILDSIEKQIDTKKQKLSQTKSLRKSLIQDLLTGKIKVKAN